MKHIMPFIFLGLICLAGCQTTLTQEQIEGNVRFAINQGQSAENIKQLLLEADDPSQAAAVGVWEVMDLEHIPTEMERSWSNYRESEPSSTPSVEIFEIINRYKVSVLRVLIPYGVNLNHHNAGRPLIIWGGWGNPPITPELLNFLLEHGYDPNQNGTFPSALGSCAHPGQSFLRYDHKYEMIKTLLKHGANPNVMSMGMPILHQLITYNKDNPHLLEIIQLLLDAGADVDVVDRSGKTPLDLAMSFKNSGADDVLALKIVDTLRRIDAKQAAEL